MIDIKALEGSAPEFEGYFESYKKTLKGRGEDPSLADRALELNLVRKKKLTEMEENRAQQKKVGQEIAQRKKKKEDAGELLNDMQELSARIKEMDEAAKSADEELHQHLLKMPNVCHSSVPFGSSEEDNVEIRKVGDITSPGFKAKEHGEVGENLGILDFERAGKVTGARFTFLKGLGSRLERALINFMLDIHTGEHGYEEMMPPFIVNSESLYGTGQFPKFKEDVFHLSDTDYYLVPTAEVPVTNYYRGDILTEDQLPISFTAFTPCFRSEAGSYGKDTKGLIRQHQFNKVELLKFAHPDTSYEEHEKLTSHAEEILKRLELPYRAVNLCTGDIGFGAAKCYDLEVWLPGQETYREISSCSIFEDYQSRRANIRFRPNGGGKPRFVHTINGSGLAVGRTLLAILENYQQEDGSVKIPKALQPYMRGTTVIK